MKERPILFSAPMVRAILAGTKTQTRLVVKPQPTGFLGGPGVTMEDGTPAPRVPVDDCAGEFGRVIQCPYGQPGDRLWVREAFAHVFDDKFGPVPDSIIYRADEGNGDWPHGWRPSIHMPRCASRILLEIISVRVERLQEISEADAIAEGVSPDMGLRWKSGDDTPRGMYGELWESINGPGSWDANPFVWVVEFKRVQP